MTTPAHVPAATPPQPVTLKPGAIGFVDALVIGLASTSPAYSLAAVIGAIVALAGVHAPGVLLASFLPMVLTAAAFYHLNKVDTDCGTTFSWTTRAIGPWLGWIGGWAIAMTGVLVIGSLADVGVRFGYLALGLDGLAESKAAVMTGAVIVIVALTALCVRGTELSSGIQNALIVVQVGALLVFAVAAVVAVARGDALAGAPQPSLNWLNPFGAGGAALTGGLLLGVFAYWGWESAVNLSEETTNRESTPGRAAIVSTLVLLVTYVGTTFALTAFVGTEFLADNAEAEEFLFGLIADEALGSWSWIVLVAVATSAIASTQTTIIPASRTGLSMARRHALPGGLARIHPRYRTPDVSTWWVAGIAIVWYVSLNLISENALFDSLTALALLIAFYYALTGIACAVYFRRHLLSSARNLIFIGVGPLVGSGLLLWLLVQSVVDMSDPANSYTGQAWFGVGPPLVIAVGVFGAGVVVMLWWRSRDRRFWRERPGVVDPALVADAHQAGSRP